MATQSMTTLLKLVRGDCSLKFVCGQAYLLVVVAAVVVCISAGAHQSLVGPVLDHLLFVLVVAMVFYHLRSVKCVTMAALSARSISLECVIMGYCRAFVLLLHVLLSTETLLGAAMV